MTEMEDMIKLMEGEMGEAEMQAMQLLFRHSPNERRAFLNLAHLRDIIEATDPMENLRADQQSRITSLKYQNKLTDKIMNQVKSYQESANRVEEIRRHKALQKQ